MVAAAICFRQALAVAVLSVITEVTHSGWVLFPETQSYQSPYPACGDSFQEFGL